VMSGCTGLSAWRLPPSKCLQPRVSLAAEAERCCQRKQRRGTHLLRVLALHLADADAAMLCAYQHERAGLSAATGKHAEAFAARLAGGDLSCKVLDRVQYKKAMLEKLVWIRCSMSFLRLCCSLCCFRWSSLNSLLCMHSTHELGSCCV